MSRLRVVLGSLVGAAAIHFAFVACEPAFPTLDAAIPNDGGVLDAMRDAFVDVVGTVRDAEVREAQAQDASSGTCGCPRAETTFALTFDRGRGEEIPREDYSSATSNVAPILYLNRPGLGVSVSATFYDRDGASASLSCFVLFAPDRTLRSDYPGMCQFRLPILSLDGGITNFDGSGPITSVGPVVLEDERIELRVPEIRIPRRGTDGPPSITIRNAVFRGSFVGGHYLRVPRAFVP